jgi:hypothetical protein
LPEIREFAWEELNGIRDKDEKETTHGIHEMGSPEGLDGNSGEDE